MTAYFPLFPEDYSDTLAMLRPRRSSLQDRPVVCATFAAYLPISTGQIRPIWNGSTPKTMYLTERHYSDTLYLGVVLKALLFSLLFAAAYLAAIRLFGWVGDGFK